MFVEPFATAPGPLKCCNTPQSEVPMRAVIYVEDIWAYAVNKSSIVTKRGMFTLYVVCQLLVKYYIVNVFIFEWSISIKPKNHSLSDIYL